MRKWLYHDDFEGKIVEFEDRGELDQYYTEGWRDCFLSDKKAEEKEEVVEEKHISQMSDREHLIMMAEAVGLKIDKRWGDNRLMDEIERAQDEKLGAA